MLKHIFVGRCSPRPELRIFSITTLTLLAAITLPGCSGLTNADKASPEPTNPTSNPMPPSITTQPASQTVAVGQTATFSVAASGTAPLNYQWQKNGTGITSATSATFTIPAVMISDSRSQFSIIVSNSGGNATSNAATLIVNATPVAITVDPNNAIVTVGNSQQFIGNVTGSSNSAVTWKVSGAACAGAACGTISNKGLYVAPASVPSSAIVSVTATSVADPTKSAAANVMPLLDGPCGSAYVIDRVAELF